METHEVGVRRTNHEAGALICRAASAGRGRASEAAQQHGAAGSWHTRDYFGQGFCTPKAGLAPQGESVRGS